MYVWPLTAFYLITSRNVNIKTKAKHWQQNLGCFLIQIIPVDYVIAAIKVRALKSSHYMYNELRAVEQVEHLSVFILHSLFI